MQRPCFTRIREQRIISITFKQRFSFLFLDTWKLKSDYFNLIFIYFYLINWLIDLWHRFLVYLKIKFFKRREAFSWLVIGRFMLQFLLPITWRVRFFSVSANHYLSSKKAQNAECYYICPLGVGRAGVLRAQRQQRCWCDGAPHTHR